MILDVPYVSQLSSTATAPDDCGQASVLMLLRFYGRVADRVTVDMLSRDTRGKTAATQLRALAARYDLPLKADTRKDVTSGLAAMLTAGHPVVLLVDYRDLLFPVHLASGVDQGWHWLVVCGIQDGTWVVHDPLWHPSQREGRGGARLGLTDATLRAAYRGHRLYHIHAS